MSGVYFTGLSGATTLTVDYIVYIERFPTQDDLDLIVSAKRSPEYDIRALELILLLHSRCPWPFHLMRTDLVIGLSLPLTWQQPSFQASHIL